MTYRFKNSPGAEGFQFRFDSLMTALGYNIEKTEADYTTDELFALGNFTSQTYIEFGLQDRANEQNGYTNRYYEDVNPPLIPKLSGNPDMKDPNHWQRLALEFFMDQAGNIYPEKSPDFVSPEWGDVVSFALKDEDLTIYERDGYEYHVYHDPGPPAYLDTINGGSTSDEYKWNHSMVAKWSSHLDPTDRVMWDISPTSIGNIDPADYLAGNRE